MNVNAFEHTFIGAVLTFDANIAHDVWLKRSVLIKCCSKVVIKNAYFTPDLRACCKPAIMPDTHTCTSSSIVIEQMYARCSHCRKQNKTETPLRIEAMLNRNCFYACEFHFNDQAYIRNKFRLVFRIFRQEYFLHGRCFVDIPYILLKYLHKTILGHM